MNNEQRVAFINSQVTCAMIEAMGMQAENRQREIQQESPAFVADDFNRLQIKYGIDHNSVIEYLN